MQVPLPWERVLWSARAGRTLRARYVLTDFRVVWLDGAQSDEIALQDVGDIRRAESWLDRLIGTSTLVIERRGTGEAFVLRGVRHGTQLAALLELVAADPPPRLDRAAVRAALHWEPGTSGPRPRYAFAGIAAAFAVVFGAFTLSGSPSTIVYPEDDAIYPGGHKRARPDIVEFMEDSVLPWARQALAPIVGGSDRVSCATCHGSGADARDWTMPSVFALPEPEFRRFWLRYQPTMDSQTRNAIYGYLAEGDKQGKAAYMREVIMPGMARLLHRPAYDFTKTYDYNRTRFAFGCYHCHQVS